MVMQKLRAAPHTDIGWEGCLCCSHQAPGLAAFPHQRATLQRDWHFLQGPLLSRRQLQRDCLPPGHQLQRDWMPGLGPVTGRHQLHGGP